MEDLVHDLLRTAVFAAAAILLGFLTPAFRLQRLARPFARLARNSVLSLALVGLLAFSAASATSGYAGLPLPKYHDEFGYLLAADTFSHGRVTNPTHPLWPFFETFHVIHRPTYMSKYPPAQGVVLAAGQLLGHAAIGLWIASALACSALTWALFAWLPPRWALLAGVLAPFHPLVVQWAQSYWGGSVAMIGGSLLAGSVRRLSEEPRSREGWLAAIGVAILAFSRPYEGAVATMLSLGLLLWMRRPGTASRLWRVAIAPLVLVGLMSVGALGYYNNRITGNPLLMPYVVHERQYSPAPVFIFQNRRPIPEYRHDVLRKLHVDWELRLYEHKRTLRGFLQMATDSVVLLAHSGWGLFTALLHDRGAIRDFLPQWFSLSLLLPLVLVPRMAAQNRWVRAAMVFLVLIMVALLPVYFVAAHFAAPAAPYAAFLLIASMRCLSVWRWRRRRPGRLIVIMLIGLWLLSFLYYCGVLKYSSGGPWTAARYRTAFIEALQDTGERHLIFVRYPPTHNPHFEWVYNAADIDGAAVVWAHDMGERNRRLIEHFSGRKVWVLANPDAPQPVLLPYAAAVR